MKANLSKIYTILIYLVSLAITIYSLTTFEHDFTLLALLFVFLLFNIIMRSLEWRIDGSGKTVSLSFDFTFGYALIANPFFLFIFFSINFIIDYYLERNKPNKSTYNGWEYLVNVSNFFLGGVAGNYLLYSLVNDVTEFTPWFMFAVILSLALCILVSNLVVLIYIYLEQEYQYMVHFTKFFKNAFIYSMVVTTPVIMLLIYFHHKQEYLVGLVFLIIVTAAMFAIKKMGDEYQYKAELDGFKKIAFIDELTGAYNVRYLNMEMNELNSKREDIALVIADIDKFKNVNDTFGHDIGDQVLKHCVQILKKELGSEDILARSGGEEFTIILKGKTYTEALTLIEKMRKKVEQTSMMTEHRKKKTAISYTLSFGMYFHRVKDSKSIQEAKIEADHLLYESKQSGRNRVTTNKMM